MSQSLEPTMLRLAEVAKQLSVSADTVRRWGRMGRIRVIKLGPRACGILKEDLDKFIAEISSQ